VSIAICFVARTGIVLGTDSRVTTTGPEGDTREDAYPKLVQYGPHPIGLAMVGAGSYGGRDFRALVAETYRECRESNTPVTVEQAARAYADVAGGIARESNATTGMVVLVAGFSPGEPFGELWEVRLPEGNVRRLTRPKSQTFVWRGRADAVQTLWWGANLGELATTMREHDIDEDVAQAVVKDLKKKCAWGPERIAWGMPLSSAVELVRFQLETQIQAERWLPGRAACGPPTQLLAINDSGLKWIDNPFATFATVGS